MIVTIITFHFKRSRRSHTTCIIHTDEHLQISICK